MSLPERAWSTVIGISACVVPSVLWPVRPSLAYRNKSVNRWRNKVMTAALNILHCCSSDVTLRHLEFRFVYLLSATNNSHLIRRRSILGRLIAISANFLGSSVVSWTFTVVTYSMFEGRNGLIYRKIMTADYQYPHSADGW